jgi:hypothetical protein
MVIFKERNFTRYDARVLVRISKIDFFQNVNYLEWNVKKICVSKEPMKPYETEFLRIPLIETILRFQYNKEKLNNHYRDYNCETIQEYMENIKDYSTNYIAIDVMMHIPSLRTEDYLRKVDNREILPYFIKNSRVPVLHFQKSYRSIIYDFM